MRIILLLMLFPIMAVASNGDRQGFLSAWENHQTNSETVEEFEKISEGKYYIKFKSLPYEGELILLTYEVE